MYYIWSIEHEAWWKPAKCGYTICVYEAGKYTKTEADDILKQANLVKVNECKIPIECVVI